MAKRKNRHRLPLLDSDQDFLDAFQDRPRNDAGAPEPEPEPDTQKQPTPVSREAVEAEEADFESMLEAWFRQDRAKPVKKPDPVPLGKRLRRYPPPEANLDLHGYQAAGAGLRAASFIQSCRHQGFFTIRIIVGKGRHSDGGAVLPDVVEAVVRKMKGQGLVLGYDWDRQVRSRSGALIIYLQQFEQYE